MTKQLEDDDESLSDSLIQLISAIFTNAVNDSVSKYVKVRDEARKFINKSNPTFKMYCDIMGIEETWLEEKLWEKVREKEIKVGKKRKHLELLRKSYMKI